MICIIFWSCNLNLNDHQRVHYLDKKKFVYYLWMKIFTVNMNKRSSLYGIWLGHKTSTNLNYFLCMHSTKKIKINNDLITYEFFFTFHIKFFFLIISNEWHHYIDMYIFKNSTWKYTCETRLDENQFKSKHDEFCMDQWNDFASSPWKSS